MLTIYAPLDNHKSKCWEIFNGIKSSWPEKVDIKDNRDMLLPSSNSMFWGFVNNNLNFVQHIERNNLHYWFTDTPYFGRFDNRDLRIDNHYWRICKNGIHAQFVENCPSDRFETFKMNLKPLRQHGEHILVCPSSAQINLYLKQPSWLAQTLDELKKYTDRPVKVRLKPRKNGTSGPAVADVPIEQDLQQAWACVTSCSISAIESVLSGVPVFSHKKSFAAAVANFNLSDIEKPKWKDPSQWLHSLCYQQFTPEEFANGTAVDILKGIGHL
jgi:hypothetical protein